MSREKIYSEMKDMLGLVPSFFKELPESTLGYEWELFKKMELEEGVIPAKYRELMGLAISAATKCSYCTLFHSEMAKLNGATAEEIEAAVHCAKTSTGWSTYVNGMQLDYDEFKSEVGKISKYIGKHGKVRKAA